MRYRTQSLRLSSALFSFVLTSCSPPPPSPTHLSDKSAVGTGEVLPNEEPEPEQDSKPAPPPTPVTPITQMPSPSPAPIPAVPPMPAPVVISSEGDGQFNGPWKTVVPYPSEKSTDSLPSFRMYAKDSKIFPRGDSSKAPNINQLESRNIAVYIPAGLDKTKEYPFMIGLDGQYWKTWLYSAMDKLVTTKKIPMMVGIFVENGGGDSRGQQRSLEYDKVNDANARFMAEEVIPAVEAKYGIKLTKNGEGGGIFGGSSSGAAAFTLCWFKSDRFQKVLGYSSTFTSQGGEGNVGTDGAWAYHTTLIPNAPAKPCRISLEVAESDNNYFNSTTEGNIKTFEALKAKNYHVRLYVAPNAVHVDANAVKASIMDDLIWLWRDYPKN